jgi:hypothetical protein
VHGGIGDNWIRHNRVDQLVEVFEFIKKNVSEKKFLGAS